MKKYKAINDTVKPVLTSASPTGESTHVLCCDYPFVFLKYLYLEDGYMTEIAIGE